MYQYVRAFIPLTVFVIIVFSTGAFGQASDPVIGTWELNSAKSKFSPGTAPKSETRAYVAAGSEIKASSKGVGVDGKPWASLWTVAYDGKEHPETGNPDADSLLVKRIDAFTTEFTEKKAGKVVITGTRVISRDGKVMTLTSKGTNAKGQAIDEVVVYDKK